MSDFSSRDERSWLSGKGSENNFTNNTTNPTPTFHHDFNINVIYLREEGQ